MITPIQLGKKQFPINVFYAPLAGCSDFAFRKMTSRYKPGLIFCEMVKMDAIVRNDKGTFHLLDYSPDMHPIGGQLCGSKPEIAGKAAKIIEALGFDTVDFNCGCPVDKVTKDGSGSGMLKNISCIGDIIANMVAAVTIPVTVKIRAGWDEQSIVASKIVKIAEEAGASCLTIHGRTREQGYVGPAHWEWIAECKKAATRIPIIGNGDLFSVESVFEMLETTKCDGVLIARGTMGQPWLVNDIRTFVTTGTIPSHSIEERRKALLDHFNYTKAYLPDRRVIVDMRRVGCWYFTKSAGTRAFRDAINHANSVDEIEEIIKSFPIGTVQ